MLSIAFSSVFVDDQAKAADFYTRVLGFELCADVPLGDAHRWLTVRSSTTPGSVELVLEPNSNPVATTYQQGLKSQNIPCTSFATDDILAEVARLKGLGVVFTQEPTDIGPAILATFDDTCGNLVQIAQSKVPPPAAPQPPAA
jgi:predicted enzyme related to lactoylglutathione lyase